MSASEVLKLYYEHFGRLPVAPNHLMSFSRQLPHVPTLKWIQAKSIMKKEQYCARVQEKNANSSADTTTNTAMHTAMNTMSNNTTQKSYDTEQMSLSLHAENSTKHSVNHSVPANFKYATVVILPPSLSPVIDHSPLQSLPPDALESFPYSSGGDIRPQLQTDHSSQSAPGTVRFKPTESEKTQQQYIQPPLSNIIHLQQINTDTTQSTMYVPIDIETHNSLSDNEELLYAYNDAYNTHVIISTSDTSSFDSGHGNLVAQSTNSLTNNNQTNNDDSDVINSDRDSLHSGCPIYHDEDVYGQNALICAEERSVFESLQNKLIEMDDFSRDYLDLRSNYLFNKRKVDKNRQINLKRTKQKIGECFNELYILLKEKENASLYQLDEMYKAQSVINAKIDLNEKNTNNDAQKQLAQHMTYISHKVAKFQSLTNGPKNIYQRKKRILKIDEDTETEHRSQIKYFNSVYDEMKHKLETFSDEKYIDFVLNDNVQFDCCNFLRCNEFGRVMCDIPKPSIHHIQILGNDVLNMELEESKDISMNKYTIITYQISYCYHSTSNFENIDEKQDKMQWENVEIDCYQQHNPYLIEFEIDDLNLVNADLMIKMRYLLKRDGIKMWTVCSDIYQLTQSDLYKSMSNIVPCLDDDDDDSSNDNENDNRTNNFLLPLFSNKINQEPSESAQTVCYKEEFEEDMNMTADTDCNTVHEHSHCTLDEEADDDETDTDDDDDDDSEKHDIDIVPFKKDLYFDQNEVENEMTQNQQLIQEFMKGINAASKVNNQLIKTIKDIHKQRELWMNNRLDIMNMKKRGKLTLISTNSFLKNGKHTACKSASTLSLSKSSGNSSSCSDASFQFTHSFNASHPDLTNRPSITKQIVTTISKLSNKLSNISSNSNSHNNNKCLDDIAWNQRMSVYGELCHILQENPAYVSRLTRLIQVRDSPIWCRTIVCDLFGNESDTRNEHLLLRIFEWILKDYCADAKDIDLFLSQDHIVTRMITCFMNDRCSDNLNTLNMIFERAIRELIFENDQQLNLEIDPLKVYREISKHSAHKTETTMASDTSNTSNAMLKMDSLNSHSIHSSSSIGADDDHRETVKKIIARRIEQIQVIVTFFLDRMIENARIISFGIRWICCVVASNAKMAFPDASSFELNALIGNLIYLRYFEHALNAPYEFLNVDSNAKNEIIENNFSIICKTLRSILCNERFDHSICHSDTALLHWIRQQQIGKAALFYDKLLDVPSTELSDRLNVGNYLISCKHDLQLSMKQIDLLHRELYRHQEIWSNDYNHNIPLFDVLDRLEGDIAYKYDKERVIVLDLTVIETSFNPFFVDTLHTNSEYSLDTLNQSDSGFVNVQYNKNHSDHSHSFDALSEADICAESELKCDDECLLHNDESYIYNLLFSIKYKDDDIMGIRRSLKELFIHKNIPQHIVFEYRHSLKEFLAELRNWCVIHDKEMMLALIDSVLERMDIFRMKHNVHGYNSFIHEYHCDINKIINFSKRLQLKAVTFAKARDAMIDHTNYLENKLSEYKHLLSQDVAQMIMTNKAKNQHKSSKKAIKIPYKNLLNQSVIVDDDNDENTKMHNNIVFRFVHESLDCFQVQIGSKSKSTNNRNKSDLKPSSTLSLLKLLEMRDANHCQFLLSSFTFHIDGTIHLLNGIIANKV